MVLAIVLFQEPLLAATTPLNSLVLLRVFVGLIQLVSAFCTTPSTWFVSLLVLPVFGILRLSHLQCASVSAEV